MKIMHSLTKVGLVLALALPGLAQGTPGPGMPPPNPQFHKDWDPDRMVDHMARELKLTDAQKASFKAIFAKHKDSLKAKGQAIREAHEAYRAALEKPDTPPDTLKTMNRSLADLKFERRMEARTMHQELRAVLTPEQREKAARMEGRMEGMRKARGGMGGGCGSMGCGPWGKRPGPMTPPPPAPAP